MGVLSRSWQPRLALAGTYDEAWIRNRHPKLPLDFDFATWNCAPLDMQCRHLDGNEVLTLTNLLPSEAPGVRRDEQGNTVIRFALPGHKPFVLARFEDGSMGTLPLKTDTLIVDLEEHQVIQVLRGAIMRTKPTNTLELRMKLNRDAMQVSRLVFAKEPV